MLLALLGIDLALHRIPAVFLLGRAGRAGIGGRIGLARAGGSGGRRARSRAGRRVIALPITRDERRGEYAEKQDGSWLHLGLLCECAAKLQLPSHLTRG